MRDTLKLIVAASLLAALATACGQKQDESAASSEQSAENPTRTAEAPGGAPGTTTNFEEQEQPSQEQPSSQQ
jgi:hypothetical protein